MNLYPKYYQTLVDVVHEIVIYNGKFIMISTMFYGTNTLPPESP